MKLFNFFREKQKRDAPSRFSDFFLHASEAKKAEVFKEAARRANEDQKKIFEQSRLKTKAN